MTRPHLHLHATSVFVRDYDRALAFYVDTLKFGLITNRHTGTAQPWVAVIPPDGTAVLSLVMADPGSEGEALIGKATPIVFITDDIHAQFELWQRAGVRFAHAPVAAEWGGVYTSFEDVDGNTFMLASVDPMTRQLEAERRAQAERAEAERRAAHERAIASEVQAHLFPQVKPEVRTLSYAGRCLQARQVGGDYYDYLTLGGDRLGLVVADIAGKGMPAALLMAHLQASVRSQSASAADDPRRFLDIVHERFWAATPPQAYATAFFGEYDAGTRRLRYANCGHPPALLVRASGRVDRLAATCPVIGLFETWRSELDECAIETGDVLVVYSDGVTDAVDESGREFGDDRLHASVLARRHEDAAAVLEGLIADVRAFGTGEQTDDITVLVARGV